MNVSESKYYLVILRNGVKFKVSKFGLDEIKRAITSVAELEGAIDGYFLTWNDLVLRVNDISAIISHENIV